MTARCGGFRAHPKFDWGPLAPVSDVVGARSLPSSLARGSPSGRGACGDGELQHGWILDLNSTDPYMPNRPMIRSSAHSAAVLGLPCPAGLPNPSEPRDLRRIEIPQGLGPIIVATAAPCGLELQWAQCEPLCWRLDTTLCVVIVWVSNHDRIFREARPTSLRRNVSRVHK